MKSEKGMCSLHIVLHERTGVVSAAGSTFQLAPKNFSSYLELRNQSSMWGLGEKIQDVMVGIGAAGVARNL